MKKNLKSVISFVIALALSLSSVSALAAVSYDDVPADASYAEAVANLTAIGVVEGYGDGKFNPDNNITRAEVAAMIVRALAKNEAAISSQGTTKFSDVAADHWASGYINVASSGNGAFINGMGDGTFAPEENVTYAQVIKMLVAGIGYGDWGISYGGYPTGYISAAKQLEITEGVPSVGADEAATRAVVAQLINNAIDTPLLALDKYSPVDPEYEIMDGTDGNDYETVLTYYHNIYKVEGRIVGTKKSGAAIDADEVIFSIEKTDNYDGEVVKKADADPMEVQMNVGDTDAANYLEVYAKMMVKVEDDEDPVILSCVASGKNKTVELFAGAWDDEYYDSMDESLAAAFQGGNKNQVWYYANEEKSGKSTRYYLDDEFKLYVNGVEITADENAVEDYVFNNSVGTITLVDTPSESSNSTDGRYDSVFVAYYATGIIDSVTSSGKAYFDVVANTGSSSTSSVEFDDDDEDLVYNITLNGEEIAYTDLQTGDVVSIAYDITTSFADSEFYDVLVSRDVVEGKVNETSEDDNEIVVDGTTYGMVSDDLASYENFELGRSYTLYLDVFGNVVDYEKLASTVKYGIISRAYHSDDADEDRIALYDTTATKKTFVVADSFEVEGSSSINTIEDLIDNMDDTTKGAAAVSRVVEYETNSKGEIKSVKLLGENATPEEDQKYNEKNSKIGSLKVDDNTVIINVDDKTFSTVALSTLVDESVYTANGYDKEDGVYGLVVITDGVGSYTVDSRFAVVNKVTQGTNEDGDEVDKISLYTAGSDEIQVVYTDGTGIAEDAVAAGTDDVVGLAKGDVIIYTTNAAGVIEEGANIQVIFSAGDSYSDVDLDSTFNTPSNWDPNGETEVYMAFGPVIDKSSETITIGEVIDGKYTYTEDADGVTVDSLDLDSDVAVYVYDYNNSSSNRLSVGTTASIVKTNVATKIMLPSEETAGEEDERDWDRVIIDWSDSETPDPVYALVKVVDEEVTDVFVIIPDED